MIPSRESDKAPGFWGRRLLLSISLVIILSLTIATPGGILDHAHYIGYAVCHQIPERTFFFNGLPLPLCARCSGQYLAALGGLIWLAASGRLRAGQLPPRPIIGLLLIFVGIWGFDGLNSYLTFFPGLPYLYAPSNLLRASTGSLEGIAVAALLTPFFNLTIWRRPTELPTLHGGRDLLQWMIVCLAIILMLESHWAPLLYPLALLSVLGVLALLLMINAMIVALALRRDGMAETWQDAALVLAPGLALALSEILVIDLARAAVTQWLRLPF